MVKAACLSHILSVCLFLPILLKGCLFPWMAHGRDIFPFGLLWKLCQVKCLGNQLVARQTLKAAYLFVYTAIQLPVKRLDDHRGSPLAVMDWITIPGYGKVVFVVILQQSFWRIKQPESD